MFSIAEIVNSPLPMCAAMFVIGAATAVAAALYLQGHPADGDR